MIMKPTTPQNYDNEIISKDRPEETTNTLTWWAYKHMKQTDHGMSYNMYYQLERKAWKRNEWEWRQGRFSQYARYRHVPIGRYLTFSEGARMDKKFKQWEYNFRKFKTLTPI